MKARGREQEEKKRVYLVLFTKLSVFSTKFLLVRIRTIPCEAKTHRRVAGGGLVCRRKTTRALLPTAND